MPTLCPKCAHMSYMLRLAYKKKNLLHRTIHVQSPIGLQQSKQINLRNSSLRNKDYNSTNPYIKSSSLGNDTVLPKQAQVVVCGAGTVANSVAYHLVQNGWNDILVLEQQKIGTGTSHFGSGTLGLFRPIADRNLVMYSIKLYRQLEELGYDIGIELQQKIMFIWIELSQLCLLLPCHLG